MLTMCIFMIGNISILPILTKGLKTKVSPHWWVSKIFFVWNGNRNPGKKMLPNRSLYLCLNCTEPLSKSWRVILICLTQEGLWQACVIVLGWEVVRVLDAEVGEGWSLLWVGVQTRSYSDCISERCFPLLIIYIEREKVKDRITVSFASYIN